MSPAVHGRVRVGVLLSGGGRTLQNLLDQRATGRLPIDVVVVIADRADAFGLERARRAGIPAVFERDPARIQQILREHRVELVCLAGYLRLFPVGEAWAGRVLNIHPALLPRHGGKGCYGERVHAAVLAAGEAETGCTVHLCDDHYDRGEILVQKRVPVLPGDDVHTLAERVFAAECEAYPEAILLWLERRHGQRSGGGTAATR
ncbi:MAG: phosphoribosylglycinamide formyltransferase [Planctomycetes bacterium]|nr:phosphoribosylglycinamide formyltransferase [Planctomycetota bacterium]